MYPGPGIGRDSRVEDAAARRLWRRTSGQPHARQRGVSTTCLP